MKYYAGIGSRNVPIEIQNQCTLIAELLATYGYILRSGNAVGCDIAFYRGSTKSEIFIPWKGYNSELCDTSNFICSISDESMMLAQRYHIGFNNARQGVRKLLARNVNIILGNDLKTPVDFVICWTRDQCESYEDYNVNTTGGTGHAILLADAYKIPIINIARSGWLERLTNII